MSTSKPAARQSDSISPPSPSDGCFENAQIAAILTELADLLESQDAGQYRVAAYRAAAKTVGGLTQPLREIEQTEGVTGLIRLPTIGESIANLIEQYLRSGHVVLLDRLRGEASAEKVFTTVPTIGPELAHRIYEQLHIETLPELFQASGDGRLDEVPGIGPKRARAIRESLASSFGRSTPPPRQFPPPDRSVSVAELLDVDREYRAKAEADRLPKIAPQSFNPGKVAWLPILHTDREGRHYTALYSNTARAHQLNTTHDWVVVYRDDDRRQGRWTIITSQFGKLRGCRIVRGREEECADLYQHQKLSNTERKV
jgi:putative hydrolase